MELLYSSSLPQSTVHAVAWSGMNLVALSVSVHAEGVVTEGYRSGRSSQLLVFDPNRPWEFHNVVGECKTIIRQLHWSLDGTRLLSLSDSGIVHIWRMKTQCINSWVAAHKQEPEGHNCKVVHASWLECRPVATINNTKEDWNEVMEFQALNPHLRILLGEAFISVTSEGKVVIYSTSLPHCQPTGGQLTTSTFLPGSGTISIANTFVTQTGSILLGAGYQGGVIKVFSLSVHLQWTNQVTITASLATELHNFRESGKISGLLMLPHADGCMVHVSYNNTQLYQWSVKDITRSGSYQSRREGVHSSLHPISYLTGSGLCLGSHDLSMQEHKMSELLVFEDVDMKEGEGKWPVEVLLTLGDSGEISVLDRDTYKELHAETLPSTEETTPPVAKRQRLMANGQRGDREDVRSAPLLCLSPNACCVLVIRDNMLQLYQIVNVVLGLKDSGVPEVSCCSRLLSLAVVSSLSPWDIAVSCTRLQARYDANFIRKLLEHFSADYEHHSSTIKDHVVRQFFTACSFLQSCMEKGLVPSLSYRNTARLYATCRLLELNLSPSSPDQGMPRLQAVCTDNKTEENLNNLAEDLNPKDFLLSPEVACHLQPHCHWLLELAIQIVAAIAEGQVHVNALLGRSVADVVMEMEDTAGPTDENPSPSMLDLLRQLLLLVFVWNKSLIQPVVPVSNGALALLFKVLTVFNLSPQSPLSEELQSEVKSNVPGYHHPHLLSLTRAAQLQGFLSGLCSAGLPESFQRGMPAPLRPQVQSHYLSLDPYSPLALVVPQGVAPPWRDRFVEGQRDLLHGGTLNKAVIQNAHLKQCSRCRSWTLASEKLAMEQNPPAPAVHQWRNAWSQSCLCGAPWTLQTSTRT